MTDSTSLCEKPKVVIIRGDWLCKRDTLYYESLQNHYELLGVSVRRTQHDLSLVDFPVVTPWSPDSALARFAFAQRLIDKTLRLRSENLMWFSSFDRMCSGASIMDVAETFHPFCRQAVRFRQNHDVKLVIRAHENIPFAHHNLRYRRETKRMVFEWADAFITCSELGKIALELEGAPPDKIHVIPIGTDLRQYAPRPRDEGFAKSLGLRADDFVVLYAGRVTWEKGVFAALYAAALNRSIANLRVVILGGGPDISLLRRQVDELGISDIVRIAGRIPSERMSDLYSVADVVVVPSIATARWQEQFGAVIMEAMACGKALIVSDSGSIPEVAGDAALYVPQGSHTALAKAISDLAADKNVVADMGKRARARCELLYDKDKVADQIGGLYEALLQT